MNYDKRCLGKFCIGIDDGLGGSPGTNHADGYRRESLRWVCILNDEVSRMNPHFLIWIQSYPRSSFARCVFQKSSRPSLRWFPFRKHCKCPIESPIRYAFRFYWPWGQAWNLYPQFRTACDRYWVHLFFLSYLQPCINIRMVRTMLGSTWSFYRIILSRNPGYC